MHLFPKTKAPALMLALMAALTCWSSSSRAAEPRVAVAIHTMLSPALRQARPLGRLAATTPLRLALILPLRNQAELTNLLRRQYTPGDPLYRKFVSPARFTQVFSPTVADYRAVSAWARAQGLTVGQAHPGRTILDVSGTASVVEQAFGLRMMQYQLRDSHVVYASADVPTLPASIAKRVSGVAGLSNFGQAHTSYRVLSPRLKLGPRIPIPGTGGNAGTGPLGGLSPNDIKYAYNLDTITSLYPNGPTGTDTSTGATVTPLDGTGVTVGVVALDGYLATDITQFATQYSLPTPVLKNVLLDGATGAVLAATGQQEVTLDISMVLALAPSASTVYVYEGNQTTAPAVMGDIFTRMSEDSDTNGNVLLNVITCSFGVTEDSQDSAVLTAENTAFQRMAAQGQSVFCASGNKGAYDDYDPTAPTLGSSLSVDDPASQPYVTGVGGTTLKYTKPAAATATKAATPGSYVSETAWKSATRDSTTGPQGTGGGSSDVWTKPDYQQGLGASPFRRDVPDVALNADPAVGYDIYVNGTAVTLGGTDAAAPLWAAFIALVDQQRVLNGLGMFGFANPSLYALALSTSYPTDFHDVTSGDNLYYPAETGYDDATGWGSFIGSKMLADFSANSDQGNQTATLSGVVADSSGAGIASATVSAVSVATGVVKATTTTDSGGDYSLTVPGDLALNIIVDTSTVTDTSTNFAGQTAANVTVAAGGSTTLNFTLNAAHTYAAGLQMISAPYDFTGTGDFAALFGLTTPLANPNPRLIQWEPSLNSYVFYPTAPADTLRLGQSYWIYFPTAAYLHKEGVAASTSGPYSITLQAGWNQIGNPFLAEVPLSTLTVTTLTGGSSATLASSTLVQSTLYRYNTTAGVYVALSPSSDVLNPFEGYWIFAKQAAILVVPATAPPPPAP